MDHDTTRPAEPKSDPSAASSLAVKGRRMMGGFPPALAVRLFVYLFAGHALAAFIYLLFEVGA